MRNIKYIVVHSTATSPTQTLEALKKSWEDEQGIKKPCFHYVILRDGEIVQTLRRKTATGSLGVNNECIHIAYMGGIDKEGNAADTLTQAQKDSLFDLLVELSEKHHTAEIVGQDEIVPDSGTSPCFNIRQWLASYIPFIADYESELDIAA